MTEKLNIILFCNRPEEKHDAGTIIDHIDAFSKYSKHNIYRFSNVQHYPPKLDLNKFDAIAIHYSSYLLNDYYISPEGKRRIQEFKGLKILFIQDEYRRINDMHEQIRQLGINILFTCIPEEEIENVYPSDKLPALIKINNLTGYVPERLVSVKTPSIADRPIDIGYRSRKLSYWYGQLAVEKWKIVDDFLAHSQNSNLQSDLSYHESKRIYGEHWLQFIQNCKTMLGVESGASVMDFTGELEREAENYQAKNPHCTFEEVYEKYLRDHDGKIKINQISPRCFEAIALKTPLVLFEGKYSNILIPDRHYISLKKDFSNISDVIAKIKNPHYLQEMADRAYEEIALNKEHSYQNFVEKFDNITSQTFINKQIAKAKSLYSFKDFSKAATSFPLTVHYQKHILTKIRFMINKLPPEMRYKIKRVLRALRR